MRIRRSIENALSSAKVIYVLADPDEKTAKVVLVPIISSLAIGKEGQKRARLAQVRLDWLLQDRYQERDAGT